MDIIGKSEEAQDEDDTKRPGPVFDRFMRRLVKEDFEAYANWLRIPLDGEVRSGSESFAGQTLYTDYLGVVDEKRVVHIEYVTRPAANFAARMTTYRGYIMEQHTGLPISQYAIVLGRGRVKSGDDPENGFALGLQTVYARETDPEVFLAQPSLAPLACLGRGDAETRGKALMESIKLVEKSPQRQLLREAALTFATLTLDAPTIQRVREESGMTVGDMADFYSETDFGEELIDRGKVLGQALGEAQGERRGKQLGREQTLAALLHQRFGNQDEIGDVARRLAIDPDIGGALARITTADELADLDDPAE